MKNIRTPATKHAEIITHSKSKLAHKPLTIKEAKFIKNLAKGFSKTDSAKLAGYSDKSAGIIAYRLMRKEKIRLALDNMGLNDEALAVVLKKHIDDGLGVKATADTSLRATELVLRLKGVLDREEVEQQTTININELKILNTNELNQRVKDLTKDITDLT